MTSEGAAGVTQAALSNHARVPVFLTILAVCSLIALILIDATPFDSEIGYTLLVLPSLVVVWAVIATWFTILCIRYPPGRAQAEPFARRSNGGVDPLGI